MTGLLGVLALAFVWWLVRRIDTNFGTVDEGVVYRSAQLDADDLRHTITTRGIRSVLNLRGKKVGESWYDGERATTASLDVTLIEVELGSARFVTRAEVDVLLQILRDAPKPMLIHCAYGADRTGLVAALYRFSIKGDRPEDAVRQLSARWFHLPWLLRSSIAMDRSFWAYIKKV